MTQIPTAQRNHNQKVQGEFYPLQKQELIALRKTKLINNAAYVHLALRYENPFCDRPIEIMPKEFCLRWEVPESSVYAALGRLRKLEIINIKSGKVTIQWGTEQSSVISDLEGRGKREEGRREEGEEFLDSGVSSQPLEPILDSGVNSQPLEPILESNKKFSDPRIHSQILENSQLEPLPAEDLAVSQTQETLQTNQTSFQSSVEEEKEEARSKKEEAKDPVSPQTPNSPGEKEEGRGKEEEGFEGRRKKEEERRKEEGERGEKGEKEEVRRKEEEGAKKPRKRSKMKSLGNTLAKALNPNKGKPAPRDENDSQIPMELQNKLEELEIPLDATVRKALGKHHLSQAYGALAHIKNTWETINNPRGVFLFQISRQPVEPLGSRKRFMTGRDFGFTLEDVKKMYPHNWQDAARHFGVWDE